MNSNNLFYQLYSNGKQSYVSSQYVCTDAANEEDTNFSIEDGTAVITDSEGNTLASLDLSSVSDGTDGITDYTSDTKVLQPNSATLVQGLDFGLSNETLWFKLCDSFTGVDDFDGYSDLEFDMTVMSKFKPASVHINTASVREAGSADSMVDLATDLLCKWGIPVTVSLESVASTSCCEESTEIYLKFMSSQLGYEFSICNLTMNAVPQSEDFPDSPFTEETITVQDVLDAIAYVAPEKHACPEDGWGAYYGMGCVHYTNRETGEDVIDGSSEVAVLFNIDPDDYTHFKDGHVTVIANSSMTELEGIEGGAWLDETSPYVKTSMPETYSDSSIYTAAFKQNAFPQAKEGEYVTKDASFAFIDGSISFEADVRPMTDWMNGSGWDITIPKWTTLMLREDWEDMHADDEIEADIWDRPLSTKVESPSSTASKYVIDCSLYIYILDNASVGLPTACKYGSFNDASIDSSADVFTYIEGRYAYWPEDIFNIYKELSEATGICDLADASASLKCTPIEDVSLRVNACKYPNGSFRGIVIAPVYPEGYVDDYSPLKLNIVKDSVTMYEEVMEWDPSDGSASSLDPCCKHCGADVGLIPLYQKKDVAVRAALQDYAKPVAIDCSCTIEADKYASMQDILQPCDECAGKLREVMGIHQYVNWVDENDDWIKFKTLFAIVAGKDSTTSDEKQNVNSVIIYNPNDVPLKLKCLVYA